MKSNFNLSSKSPVRNLINSHQVPSEDIYYGQIHFHAKYVNISLQDDLRLW